MNKSARSCAWTEGCASSRTAFLEVALHNGSDEGPPTETRRGLRLTSAVYSLLALTVAAATAVRVAPLVEGGDRLQRQCVSEDGYLMLTIARNIALGRGFSVSDGTIPSNGTQPLSALLYALCFACAGGDKLLGLYPVVGVQVAASIVTAVLLVVFTRQHFYRGPYPALVALVAAVVWYASPTSVGHTQNSLETGLCALLILLSVASYDAALPALRRTLCLPWCAALGVILGIAFLGRNDACFVIGAMLGVHLVCGYRARILGRALGQAVLIGAVSVVVALPWLWFNLARFGHVVPISGRAEALHVVFGHNAAPALAALLENILLVLRIPAAMQDEPFVVAGSAAALALAAGLAWWQRRWLAERFSAGMAVLACFVAALCTYYALFFGMPCFLGRYFFPAVMLVAVVASAAAVESIHRRRSARARCVAAAGAFAAAAFCLALNARLYFQGRDHLHFQVVDWVAANVPEDTWVAAVQTGTLGYYHDRTINLDGKVDPYAFAARRQDRISDYVIERQVEYIVDWAGIAKWARWPQFAANYELVLEDSGRDLAVLRRR